MSLQLRTLADLGFTTLLRPIAQIVMALLWGGIVVFRALVANYDAAVMSCVTKHYGPSPKAFIIVLLIGAFFINLANAIVIPLSVGWFG